MVVGRERAECVRLSDLALVTFAHDHGDDVRRFPSAWLTSSEASEELSKD